MAIGCFWPFDLYMFFLTAAMKILFLRMLVRLLWTANGYHFLALSMRWSTSWIICMNTSPSAPIKGFWGQNHLLNGAPQALYIDLVGTENLLKTWSYGWHANFCILLSPCFHNNCLQLLVFLLDTNRRNMIAWLGMQIRLFLISLFP